MGEFIINDKNNYGYIPIPKNASNFMRRVFINVLGWNNTATISTEYQENPMVVCLRDPIDRWCAGVAEYLNRFHPELDIQNDSILQFLVERVLFDDHTTPQADFLHDMNTDNLIFFKFGPDLSANLCSYVNETFNSNINIEQLYPRSIGFINDSGLFPRKKENKQTLKKYLTNNPSYVTRITELYFTDFDLINNVAFYGENKNEEC